MKVVERLSLPLSVREQVVARLSARTFDLQLGALITAALWLGIAGEEALRFPNLINALAWLLPILALIMIIDAVIHALFGTTPGRCWLGVSITTAEGRPLSLQQHLRRNGAIWLQGLACFFLPLSIFTFYAYCARLMKGQASSYDTKKGYQVSIKAVPAARTNAFSAALFLSSLSIIFLAGVAAREIAQVYLPI